MRIGPSLRRTANNALLNMADSITSAAKRTKPRRMKPLRLTDEQILEVRTEWHHKNTKVEHLAAKWSVDVKWMKAVVNYEVRARLVPRLR